MIELYRARGLRFRLMLALAAAAVASPGGLAAAAERDATLLAPLFPPGHVASAQPDGGEPSKGSPLVVRWSAPDWSGKATSCGLLGGANLLADVHAARLVDPTAWSACTGLAWNPFRTLEKIDPDIVVGDKAYRDYVLPVDVSLDDELVGTEVVLQLFPESSATAMAEHLKLQGLEVLGSDESTDQVTIFARTFSDLRKACSSAEVQWATEVSSADLRNGTTSWMIQTGVRNRRRLFENGLDGREQVVGLIDDLVDPLHCSYVGRIAYNRIGGQPGSSEADSHGTAVAGIIVGRQPHDLTHTRSGQAPGATLAFSYLYDFAGTGGNASFYGALERLHCKDKAKIFSNSWGDDRQDGHSQWGYEADHFMWQHEDSLVLFATSNSGYVTAPENARNVLAVGASRQAAMQDYVGGREALDGTWDGRFKPEIFAPGCRIVSALAGTTCGFGRAGAQGAGSCSTSWATAAVAGAAALVRQYFALGWHPSGKPEGGDSCNPSGALVKAVLLNSTANMRNAPKAGDTCPPSFTEGWGRLLLDDSLVVNDKSADEGQRPNLAVVDVRRCNGLEAREEREYKIKVQPHKPLRVTLVWNDPALSPLAPSLVVNDLDLVVVQGDQRYCGNSTEPDGKCGGQPDRKNNVEQVSITPQGEGPWIELSVIVKGSSIYGDPPGYALVISGSLDRPAGMTGGDCSDLMGASRKIDPGDSSLSREQPSQSDDDITQACLRLTSAEEPEVDWLIDVTFDPDPMRPTVTGGSIQGSGLCGSGEWKVKGGRLGARLMLDARYPESGSADCVESMSITGISQEDFIVGQGRTYTYRGRYELEGKEPFRRHHAVLSFGPCRKDTALARPLPASSPSVLPCETTPSPTPATAAGAAHDHGW